MKQTFFQLFNGIADYVPADKHFTSQSEIDMLNNHFGLDSMNAYDLRNLRDFAVMHYDSAMDNEMVVENGVCTRTERFWTLLAAMQSVTAVIDHFIYRA